MSVQSPGRTLSAIDSKPPAPPAAGAGAVYRMYDAAGSLLYIGSSGDVVTRWAQHKSRSLWWQEAKLLAVDWFASRGEAYEEEYRAIRAQQPTRNQLGVFPYWEAQPMTEPVRRVLEALDQLEEIDDVEARVRAKSRIMAAQVERNAEWA